MIWEMYQYLNDYSFKKFDNVCDYFYMVCTNSCKYIYIYRKCMYQIITYNCPTTFQVEQESTTSSLGLFVRRFTFLGKILSGSNLNWRFSDIQPTDFILAWAVGPTIKTRSLIFFLFWPAVCMLVVHCRNPWHKIASSTR